MISGPEALKFVDGLGNFLTSLTDVGTKVKSFLGSATDLADAVTTKVQLETDAESEMKFKDKLAKVKDAELDARLATAKAIKAKADAEFRRADRSWRQPKKREIQGPGESVREELSPGTREVKRGFSNDTLKKQLQTRVQQSP